LKVADQFWLKGRQVPVGIAPDKADSGDALAIETAALVLARSWSMAKRAKAEKSRKRLKSRCRQQNALKSIARR